MAKYNVKREDGLWVKSWARNTATNNQDEAIKVDRNFAEDLAREYNGSYYLAKEKPTNRSGKVIIEKKAERIGDPHIAPYSPNNNDQYVEKVMAEGKKRSSQYEQRYEHFKQVMRDNDNNILVVCDKLNGEIAPSTILGEGYLRRYLKELSKN